MSTLESFGIRFVNTNDWHLSSFGHLTQYDVGCMMLLDRWGYL